MSALERLQKNIGLIFSLLYGLLLTCQTNLSKVLTATCQPSWIVFIRSFAFLFLIPFIDWEKSRTYETIDILYYFLAGFIGVMPQALGVYSLKFLGVGDSIAIEYGGGLILTAIVGYLFLDDSFNVWIVTFICADGIGVLLVAKPSFIFVSNCESCGNEKDLGALLALSGALLSAIYPVFIHILSKRDAVCCYLLTVTLGFVGMVVTALWTSLESAWKVPERPEELIILLLCVTSSNLQMITAVKSLENEQVRTYAMAITLSAAASYLLQLTAFGEIFDVVRVSGALLILFCVVGSTACDIAKREERDQP